VDLVLLKRAGDAFVRDRITNVTTRVSVSTGGGQAGGGSGPALPGSFPPA